MTKTTAGFDIQHDAFAKPPLHIPNAAGEPYKTELVEVRSEERTVKWNFWHGPDDDRAPHNHPWESFESTIVHGGYTEIRYWVETVEADVSVVRSETKTYRKGDVNTFPNNHYHLVTEVLPGTVSRMVCGKAKPGMEWGYLDIKTGNYTKAEPDPSFIERLRANNRFMLPKPAAPSSSQAGEDPK